VRARNGIDNLHVSNRDAAMLAGRSGNRDTGRVLSVETARRLRDTGLQWHPDSGDRFVVLDRNMDSEVFMVSEMTIEVHGGGDWRVFGFNGTTEWALDSVDERDAVWLPRETQLRELLGGTFGGLSRLPDGWQVSVEVNGEPAGFTHADAEEAYALALLQLLEAAGLSSASNG
jgi:hypothetical protein